MLKHFSALCVLAIASVSFAADPLPVTIKPDDPNLYYIGRFDTRDAAGPRCEWPACSVVIHFNGTDLQMTAKDNGSDAWAVSVDGGEATRVTPGKGESVNDLATHLPAGEHVVSITRRTEPTAGVSQFLSFSLNAGGSLLPPKRMTRKLEVIGDSISCGYGNEAASEKEHHKAETSNAAMTYGSIAARELGAEYVCIAWSGRKMAPNNTIPEIYDRTLPLDKTSVWDFKAWTPDVVLINLSTNDFGKEPPTEEVWTTAYEAFIELLRTHEPKAVIYVATSPMMYGEKKALVKSYLLKVIDDRKQAGDPNVSLIEFPTQDKTNDGLGADWHPNIKTHTKDAAILVDRLKADLGWDVVK